MGFCKTVWPSTRFARLKVSQRVLSLSRIGSSSLLKSISKSPLTLKQSKMRKFFLKIEIALRKKYPYSELFWSVFFRIRNEYGEIRSISQ